MLLKGWPNILVFLGLRSSIYGTLNAITMIVPGKLELLITLDVYSHTIIQFYLYKLPITHIIHIQVLAVYLAAEPHLFPADFLSCIFLDFLLIVAMILPLVFKLNWISLLLRTKNLIKIAKSIRKILGYYSYYVFSNHFHDYTTSMFYEVILSDGDTAHSKCSKSSCLMTE